MNSKFPIAPTHVDPVYNLDPPKLKIFSIRKNTNYNTMRIPCQSIREFFVVVNSILLQQQVKKTKMRTFISNVFSLLQLQYNNKNKKITTTKTSNDQANISTK